jgi:hypothetical protein
MSCEYDKEGVMKKRVGIISIVIIILIVLYGCSNVNQQATILVPQTGQTEAQNTIVALPDGSRIEMLPGSNISVSLDNSNSPFITLQDGTMLILSNQGEDNWFTLQTNNGYRAKVKGCSMIVSFSAADQSFGLQCLVGSCVFVMDSTHSFSLDGGKSIAYQNGGLGTPETVNLIELKKIYTSDFEKCLVVPITGQEEATVTATQAEVPVFTATTVPIDLPGTATAACQTFHSKFPATPCP